MSRLWSCSLIVLMAAQSAAAEDQPKPATDPVGFWQGELDNGLIEGPFVFQIERNEGQLAGKVHLTLERIENPLNKVAFADGRLSFGLGEEDGYSGMLDQTGQSITGTLRLAGQEFPLRLDRVEKLPVLKRPQEPQSPLPYAAEDITFEHEAAQVTLAGTLTIPPGDGPFPAVVLLSGSGPQDRDGSMAGHRPFLVLADHLARQGIACLRYDDRGIGKSGGTFAGTTGADFAADAWAAVKYLQGRPQIDSKRIGLCGHSEGGSSAPLVAAAHTGEIAFLILLAAPGISGEQLLYEQTLSSLRLFDPMTDAQTVKESTAAIVAVLRSPGTTEEMQKKLQALFAQDGEKLTDEDQRKQYDQRVAFLVMHYSDPGRRWLITLEPATALKQVQCPVLALNGAKDTLVKSQQNLEAIEAALKAGGNQQATCVELPGLNHLFQTCETGLATEYGKLEETFAPSALKRISSWIAERK